CQQGEGTGTPRPRNQRPPELLLARVDADGAPLRLGPRRHRPPRRPHRAFESGQHQADVPEVLSDGEVYARYAEAGTVAATGYWLLKYHHLFMPQFVYVMKGLGKIYPPDSQVLKDIWL